MITQGARVAASVLFIVAAIHCDVIVSNDGPVTLDVPVAITAHLSTGVRHAVVYQFVDDTDRSVEVEGGDTATANFTFTDYAGIRTVRVRVAVTGNEIVTGMTFVEVHVQDKDGLLYIGTKQETNISLQLHLPKHVIEEAEFSFSWTVGVDRFSNDQPHLKYHFRDVGTKWIRAATVGRIQTDAGVRYKWGYFDTEITVKDPILSLNISGNTYLEHGQLLNLDISCNGSGPVDYCWKLFPVSGNRTNLSCTEPVTSADCSVPILYYFRDSGDYDLAIYVNNLVTSLQRNVQVHIYDVSLRPQLSTVVLPMVCSVLVVVIIAVGVVVQMRRRSHYRVETADFDFMRAEEAAHPETSWEHMWSCLRHSTGGETTHILEEKSS